MLDHVRRQGRLPAEWVAARKKASLECGGRAAIVPRASTRPCRGDDGRAYNDAGIVPKKGTCSNKWSQQCSRNSTEEMTSSDRQMLLAPYGCQSISRQDGPGAGALGSLWYRESFPKIVALPRPHRPTLPLGAQP